METNIVKDNIRIRQDEVDIVITSLTTEELIQFTKPNVYNSVKNTDGYQRPINDNHVKSIMEYIRNEQYSILPTSMVIATDKKSFKHESNKSFSFSGYLRVVDGQHRIEAMRRIVNELREDANLLYLEEEKTEAANELDVMLNWRFPVNIMLLDNDERQDRYVEIRAFVDINKKGKTVATDLANMNMLKISSELDKLPQKQAVHQISLQITKNLMDDKKCVWFNCIKTGDSENDGKIIGLGQFSKTIIPLSRNYLYTMHGKCNYYSKEIIEDVVEKLSSVLKDYWLVICDNWKSAFLYESDINAYRVNYDFCIQKGIGVSPLHRLLSTEFRANKDIERAFENSRLILQENPSSITSADWEVGETFTSYSSEAGYSKIHKILRGELNKWGEDIN